MIKIPVSASKRYDVTLGRGLLKNTGQYLKELKIGGKVAVISDSNVAPLYMESVLKSLKEAGFESFEYVFESGEKSKNAANFIKILNFLAQNRFTRTDSVLALGGGVTGDLAGFCAASYMRGINLIQLPTSLLAAVDSSVGGKTAIDLDCGKNLAGAFYQPRAVIIDTDTLKTLPDEFYFDAMGEIIKYSMIYDSPLPDMLENDSDIENIIACCVKIKAEVVENDEFESSLRRILNFGHTAAHAIEAASDFTVTHGRAVASGMGIITRAWVKRGKCEKQAEEYLIKMLNKYNLPCRTDFSASTLSKICASDKKLEGSELNLVVPERIGKCSSIKVTLSELENILKDGE